MSIIKSSFGAGGAGIGTTGRAGGSPDLPTILRDIADDLAALRTGINATTGALNTLATKLNADAGVTDTNYVDNNATVAAMKTIKG